MGVVGCDKEMLVVTPKGRLQGLGSADHQSQLSLARLEER